MVAIDQTVFDTGWQQRSPGMTDAEWLTIARQAIELLCDGLGYTVILDEGVKLSLGKGFSVDVRSAEPTLGLLDVRIRGIVGADVLKDGRLLIRSWLFLYSGNARVAPQGEEVLELELVPDGGGSWRRIEWTCGELGEHDPYLEYD